MSWLIGKPFDSIRKIANVPVPTPFIHGDADRVIPVESGRRLFETSPSTRKIFKVVPDAGHNNVALVAGATFWTRIRNFMNAAVSDAHTVSMKAIESSAQLAHPNRAFAMDKGFGLAS